MLMSGAIPRGSLCASDGVSQLIEELQYTLGEGPCVDAYQKDEVVGELDLADPVTRRHRDRHRHTTGVPKPVLDGLINEYVRRLTHERPAGHLPNPIFDRDRIGGHA
jgi:hypothetical protein